MPEDDDVVAQFFCGRPLLTSAQVALAEDKQKELFVQWNGAKEGDVVYCGERIHVEPGVFPPRADSLVLAQNMDIVPGDHVLDAGTGTGVLAVIAGIRLGWNRGSSGGIIAATDVSEAAIGNAKRNMERFTTIPPSRFRPFATQGVFPEDRDLRFDMVVANLPFRRKQAAEFSQSARMREIQRTMWDLDFAAHNTLLEQGQTWLTTKGRMLLTVANYPDAREVMRLIRAHKWKYEVIGLREFYPCLKDESYGVPVVVACLRLSR